MRRIVQDPLWRALESLAKKKAAFEKWQQQIVSDKRAAHETRIAELRPHLTRLFAKSGVIKSYSTMKTATAAFDKDKYWRRAKPEERREILEAYTAELRSHEEKARRALKESNTQSLSRHIRTMEITVATRWRDGHKTILASEQFRADPQLQKMETLDILTVFDDYTRELEKEHDEDARRKTAEYRRRGRKARDGFKVLLRELQEKGDLTQTSKWKDTLPTIRTDERYTALLGLPGSSPLELWMDAVDDLQVNAEERTTKIEEGLKAPVTLETTLADFEAMVPGVDPKEAKEAFEVIHERLTRAAAEAARIEERKRRDRIDDLRYALRKVRQVEAETTYEAVS
jgi:pre-mRNA-processing factor 40